MASQSVPLIPSYREITVPNSPGAHRRSLVGVSAQMRAKYSATCPDGDSTLEKPAASSSSNAACADAWGHIWAATEKTEQNK
jgi:hypothetical protein